MLERLAPLLILLLNRWVLSFTLLFGIALSAGEAEILPRVGPFLAAAGIWALPDLVLVGRSLGSAMGGAQVYQAVVRSVRAAHGVGAGSLLGLGLVRLAVPGLPWFLVGIIIFLLAGFAESRQLRRQLARLAVLRQ